MSLIFEFPGGFFWRDVIHFYIILDGGDKVKIFINVPLLLYTRSLSYFFICFKISIIMLFKLIEMRKNTINSENIQRMKKCVFILFCFDADVLMTLNCFLCSYTILRYETLSGSDMADGHLLIDEIATCTTISFIH